MIAVIYAAPIVIVAGAALFLAVFLFRWATGRWTWKTYK